MPTSWITSALAELGSSALVSLIKAAVGEAARRDIDLGPIGLSKKDFKEVDSRIDQALLALRKAEDSARADILSHLVICDSCEELFGQLTEAVKNGNAKVSEIAVKSLLQAHTGAQTWAVERFLLGAGSRLGKGEGVG